MLFFSGFNFIFFQTHCGTPACTDQCGPDQQPAKMTVLRWQIEPETWTVRPKAPPALIPLVVQRPLENPLGTAPVFSFGEWGTQFWVWIQDVSIKCEYHLPVGYVIAVYEECLQLPLLFFFLISIWWNGNEHSYRAFHQILWTLIFKNLIN